MDARSASSNQGRDTERRMGGRRRGEKKEGDRRKMGEKAALRDWGQMCWGAGCQVPGLMSDKRRVLLDGVCIERADVGGLVLLGVETGGCYSVRRCQNQPGICLELDSLVLVVVGWGGGGRWAWLCRHKSRGHLYTACRLISVYNPGQSAPTDDSRSNSEDAV